MCDTGIEVIYHDCTQRHIVEVSRVTPHHDVFSSQNPSLIGDQTGGVIVRVEVYDMVGSGQDCTPGATYGYHVTCDYIILADGEILVLAYRSVRYQIGSVGGSYP